MTRPTIPDVLPLAHSIYARHPAWCCLHIVLDDGNVDDVDVLFCRDYAREQGHADCLQLAEKLVEMSKTQRRKLREIERAMGRQR